MGIDKRKEKRKSLFKRVDKSMLKLLGIGIILVSISIGGLMYVSSKSANNTIYKLNRLVGPKDSYIEGLKLTFKKEDISCFGLVTFDCKIKNVIIESPSNKMKLLKVEELEIGRFTKRGIMVGRNIDLYFNFKNVIAHQEYSIVKDMTIEGKEINKILTPFNLLLKYKAKIFKNKESKIKFNLEYNSKLGKFLLNGNLDMIKRKNIVYVNKDLEIERNKLSSIAEKVFENKIVSILHNFEADITNINIDNFIYLMYKKEMNLQENKEKRKQINVHTIGMENDKLADRKLFKEEVTKRIEEAIPYKSEKEYKKFLNAFIYLTKDKNNRIKIIGTNKDNYTLDELETISDLDKLNEDQLKYFDFEIKEVKK